MKYVYFLESKLLPVNFNYPYSYIEFSKSFEMNMEELKKKIEPWHFYYNQKSLDFHFNGLKTRYPHQNLVPFARKRDNDDVACFEASIVTDNPSVIVIQDWEESGYEVKNKRKDFSEWLDVVMFLKQSLGN